MVDAPLDTVYDCSRPYNIKARIAAFRIVRSIETQQSRKMLRSEETYWYFVLQALLHKTIKGGTT